MGQARWVAVAAAGVLVGGVVLTSGVAGARGVRSAPVVSADPGGAQTLGRGRITATGTGQIQAVPDLLTLTLGVLTSAPRAQAALDKNNAEAGAVIAKLRADGVASRDIQTVQLSLNPVYSQPSPTASPKLVGYQASDIVSVNVRHLDQGGRIIDDAVSAAGADAQLQGLGYSVEHPGPVLAAAKAAAVRAATDSARAMASGAGLQLGPVESISDAQPVNTPCCYPQGLASGGAASSGGAPSLPPLQPGADVFSADVTVTFAVA